jgi:outer membrane protein TolC
MKKLILFFLLSSHFVFAQPEVTREQCYTWAREHYPRLKDAEYYSALAGLRTRNLQTAFLPSVVLKGQATYQSDVTKVEIPVPGIEVPTISKDQYKVYLEFQQNIWDGGLTRSQTLLEEAVLQTNLSQLETELYQIRNQINEAWFSALAALKSKEVLEVQQETLREKIKALESGVRNGVIESSALDALEAEILHIGQTIVEVETGYRTALKVLSILTGKALEPTVLLKTETVNPEGGSPERPELDLFAHQRNQLDQKVRLLDKSRNPRIFGFGQGGLGRPGLNMLSDEFAPYYLIGIGLSWNMLDWKKTKREKQAIGFQKKIIYAQQETFEQNLSLLLEQQKETIEKMKKLIESDQEIIDLRNKIAESSASKLKNGTLRTADYIADLNGATLAQLKLETHRILLKEAMVAYNTIKGL